MMKIAVFGSAFDPPTLGHRDAIVQCLEDFDEVWLVPSYAHAFNKKMSAYYHRVQMLQRFINDLDEPRTKAVPCEPQIKNSETEPVYSIELLQYLQQHHPNVQLSLIIGPDNQRLFDKFYQAGRLKTEFSPYIVKERLPIRSTVVRDKVAVGASIQELVTPSVGRYILEFGLYQQDVAGLSI